MRTCSLALWPWGELAERIGIGREEARAAAGLLPGELRDPEVLVPQQRANRLAELVTRRYGPGAAMVAARTVQAGHFNIVELVARSAATVADGLDLACRFMPLIHVGGQLEHARIDGRSVVQWYPPAHGELYPGYVELLFGVAFEGIRRETGEAVMPDRVWFAHPGPDDLTLYHEVLGTKVRFGMPRALFELDAATAALPLRRANAETRERAAEAAAESLQRHAKR